MDFSIEMHDYYRVFLKDCGVSRRDVCYARRRIKSEGLHFITKTLPKFAKQVLLALQSGQLCSPSEMSEFSWKGGLPVFLRGYLTGIFAKDGRLLENPDPMDLWVVRQVCEYSYKLSLDFSDEVLEEAEAAFVKTDLSLPTACDVDISTLEKIRRNVERHYAFGSPDSLFSGYRPRNGPGTFSSDSSERSVPWYLEKTDSVLSRVVPRKYNGIKGFFKSYPSSPEKVILGSDTAEHSELLFVPKDSRGPRTIIREPNKRLMVQMAYFDFMVDALERQTHKRVNFRDQQINRDLARQGSRTGRWSTIDLSEASDRVSFSVCSRLFRNVPTLRYFINQRSTHVKLPSGKLHRLRKLAGMGSGLTFATMAFLIHVTIATALERFYGSYQKASRDVYVYGDDIIVPTAYVSIAMKALDAIGLRVNTSKSFTRPSRNVFRESCGGDYLCGQEVGPKRLKLTGGVTNPTGSRIVLTKDASVLQLERHCRELVADGFISSANYLYKLLERSLGKLPEISGDTPVLGRWSRHSRPSYHPSDTGTYRKKTCIVPIPVRKVHPHPNPYRFIGKRLKSLEISKLENLLFGDVSRFDGCSVSIPRNIKLRKRRVSEYSLM